VLIILAIFTVQVMLTFNINKKSADIQANYPITDCTDVNHLYGDTLEKFAMIQWDDLKNGVPNTKKAYMCFCSGYLKDNGWWDTINNEFEVTNNLGREISGYACSDWYFGKKKVTLMKLSVSAVIVMFNSILRFAITNLSKWIGKRTVG
jgi:hypothetical protein